MKHTLTATLALVLLFLCAQLVGLVTVSKYVDIRATSETGVTKIYQEKYIIEPPEVQESFSFFYILFAVLIGTVLALIIVWFNRVRIWRFWFMASVLICLLIGIFPYVDMLTNYISKGLLPATSVKVITLVVALALTLWKSYRPNFLVYNLVEVLMYGGIAALLVPILNLTSVVILLVVISIYDFWAVYKTKHMVSLAKFQSSAKLFAGLLVPYKRVSGASTGGKRVSGGSQQAILGGGDIAFPLLFSGVVLKLTGSFLSAFIITLFAAAALMGLFIVAKKQKYYPAMPFISMGAFLGYLITLLI